jgi:hypothetical protein
MPGAANAHLIEVTGGALATLQAALEAFKGADASQGAETPSKSDVIKAAERVRGEATKGARVASETAAAARRRPRALCCDERCFFVCVTSHPLVVRASHKTNKQQKQWA